MEPETEILLRNALDTLPKQQKIILVKKYYMGYSDTEIAHHLDISRQAVNRSKSRALKKIRELIDN
jgi:RNA polymerase sigma factor (sigma-70 family)